MSSNELGEIVTFYSYKGGTGRSMALSNVACILAESQSKDKGVLMIDWDLEAPGLHRFFHDKFTRRFRVSNDPINEFNLNPGLIDLFLELESLAPKAYFDNIDEAEKSAIDILEKIDLEKFVIETDIPNLSLLKAGCFDKNYSKKVNTFNWENLYNRSPYLFSSFAEKLVREYKYVLIDSRTGHTDIGGICTALMPHKLVAVFVPNSQNYLGVQESVQQATDYRRKSEDLRPLLVYPLPTRIESSRDDLRAEWRFGNPNKDIMGYQPMFEKLFKEIYDINECNLGEYFEEVLVQYSPDYAYGEDIAVILEKIDDRFSLSKSYRVFANWLLESRTPWQRSNKDNDNLLVSLGNQANILYSKGDLEGALKLYKEQESISRKLKIKDGLQASLRNQANILYIRGDLDGALRLTKEQERICRELGDKDSLQVSLGNQASIIYSRGNLDGAMKLYKEQEKIIRKLGNKSSLQISLGNQANIFYLRRETEKAIEYYEQALKIAKEIGDISNEGFLLGNLGNAYNDLGETEKAIDYYEQALKINPEDLEIWHRKEDILYKDSRYEDALEALEKELKINSGDGRAWYYKACVFSLMNKKNEALADLRRAVELDPSYRRMAKSNKDFEKLLEEKDFIDIVFEPKTIRNSTSTLPNFFISYPHIRPFEADYIETLLRRRNIQVFRDESDLGVGYDITTQIKKAMYAADVFIAVYCTEYVCSPWCCDELELALDLYGSGKLKLWIICIDDTRVVQKRARNLINFHVRTRDEIEGCILNLLEHELGR